MSDSYPGWLPRVRKDPLGPQGYNSLISGFRWVEGLFGREHIHGTGEHNATEIPREVGSVYITAGPTGNKEGFRYVTAATRSAVGTIQLATDATKYTFLQQMGLQVGNCSETGITKPCITQALILSSSSIEFYSKYLSSDLAGGAAPGNAWAAEDANFVVGIHGLPISPGATATESGLVIKGNTFSDATARWNAHVAADAGLRSDFRVEHSVAGVHTNREVAKTWASIQVRLGGGAYTIADSSARNPCVSATYVGAGIVDLTFPTAWALSAQPFVMPDYDRINGGAPGDIYVICTPRSAITTTVVRAYIYKYDTAALTWARADTGFFIAVHGG